MTDGEVSTQREGSVSSAAAENSSAAPLENHASTRRSSTQVNRMLIGVGLRTELDNEVQELARLIEHELAHEVPGPVSQAADTLEVRAAFLRHRFVTPVSRYESGERFYSYLDTTLNLTSIVAGVGASTAAALNAPKGITIAFGLIVGFLQSISQWLKPSQRSTRRGHAAAEVRTEAWNLLQGYDRYRGKSFDAGWRIFCDQVNRVGQREEADEYKEAMQPVGRQAASS